MSNDTNLVALSTTDKISTVSCTINDIQTQLATLESTFIDYASETSTSLEESTKFQDQALKLFSGIGISLSNLQKDVKNQQILMTNHLGTIYSELDKLNSTCVRIPDQLSNHKSRITVLGSLYSVYSEKHYSKFSKWIHKKLFGIVIEDLSITKN